MQIMYNKNVMNTLDLLRKCGDEMINGTCDVRAEWQAISNPLCNRLVMNSSDNIEAHM